MSIDTFKSLSTAFRDKLYTSLLDAGVQPGEASVVANSDLSDLIDDDEWAEAVSNDADALV